MRYRVKKDFVLEGTLLAWGDSLFLQQSQGDKKDEWEVYSLFTRKFVGRMLSHDIEINLTEEQDSPKDKYKKRLSKSIKDISLILIAFILPLWGIARQKSDRILHFKCWVPKSRVIPPSITWSTKIIQVGDDLFELHLKAKMDSGYFIYPANQPNCEWAPQVSFARSPQWQALDGPDIYYYDNRLKDWKCFPLAITLCNAYVYFDSAIFIQNIRRIAKNATIEGKVEYYLLRADTIGEKMKYEFKHSTHPQVDSVLQTMVATPKPTKNYTSYSTVTYTTYCGNVSHKRRSFINRAWWRIKHPFL